MQRLHCPNKPHSFVHTFPRMFLVQNLEFSPLLSSFIRPLPHRIKLSLSLFFSVHWSWMSFSLGRRVIKPVIRQSRGWLLKPLSHLLFLISDKGTGRHSSGSLDSGRGDTNGSSDAHNIFSAPFPSVLSSTLLSGGATPWIIFSKEINRVLGMQLLSYINVKGLECPLRCNLW